MDMMHERRAFQYRCLKDIIGQFHISSTVGKLIKLKDLDAIPALLIVLSSASFFATKHQT